MPDREEAIREALAILLLEGVADEALPELEALLAREDAPGIRDFFGGLYPRLAQVLGRATI